MNSPDTALAAAILLLLVIVLVRELAPPAAAMLGALVACVLVGILPPEQAFAGLSNPATISIAGLFVVARAVRDHAGIDEVIGRFLGDGTGGERRALGRFVPPVILLSGLMNNTPLVAAGAPVIRGWAERHGIAATKLLMPLSFAAILGGTLTLIGTGPNLVISGMLVAAGQPALGFFELTPVALPMAVAGGAALIVLGPRLLPDRRQPRRPLVSLARGTTGRARLADVAGSGGHVPEAADDVCRSRRGTHHRRLILSTFVGMVLLAMSGLVPVLSAILLACTVLVVSGAIRFRRAVEALDLDVLMVVAAAIGLGNVVTASGLAATLAGGIEVGVRSAGPLAALTLVAAGTLLLTEILTNAAAAALMLPIALDTAQRIEADPRAFAVAVAVAASSSFLTPIGYQTNTIVHGLGGYRFGDYWRLGLPLTGLSLAAILLVVPAVWG